jgi:uncharacterized protein
MLSTNPFVSVPQAPISRNRPFRVLCLSGGGFRGLYTARVLEMLEAQLGTRLAQHFDLLCGTSVGGLLALGLAAEHSATSLRELLERHGPEIFRQRLSRRLLSYMRAKHDPQGLRSVLIGLFGTTTLGELLHPVVIPAVDASAGVAVMFKTPHHPDLKVDHARSLVEVALATSAAPSYFPIFRASDARLYVDGGLVANTPGQCGLHEAEVFFDCSPVDVHILAVGTASAGRNVRSGRSAWARDLGWARWGSRLFDVTISAQESLVHNLLRHRCRERYVVIDSVIDTERAKDVEELDCASEAAIDTLLAAASKAAQQFIGSRAFTELAAHRPPQRAFYYGPRVQASGAIS